MQQVGAAPWPGGAKAWYAVGVLVLAVVFSFLDRIIIALLVEPLRTDLGLSDTQLGLLQGLAFAVFYAVVGLPIGRWSDRYSRRAIIAAGVFLWSIMTAVCGLARNFWELFWARVGVGVGEAALGPAAFSMISDLFPREKLGRALGVYQAGAFVGAGIALLLGGLVIQMVSRSGELTWPLVGEVRPWQVVFFVVGLPGVLVAALMWTVAEPARRGKLAGHADVIPLGEVIRYGLRRWRVYGSLFIGFALLSVPITTILTWVPAYFGRVLHFAPPQVGMTLGSILVVLSPAGVYAGGWLSDLLQQRGHRDAMYRVGLLAATLLAPVSHFATTSADPQVATWWFALFVFCASLALAMAPAALQVVTPNQMRAQVSATWMLFLNIITAGIGPTAVGVITDRVFADPMAVGQSIALVNVVSVPLAGLALWAGLRHFRAAVADQPAAG
jgi:MFS family permease